MSATTARIEMRVSEDHKALVEKAASVAGQSVTAFALTTLIERAHQVLLEHETTVLSARDRDAFLRAVSETRPNATLRRAAAKFTARHGRR